ncbi:MAG: FRG domain-containing protein, partial [Syntrophales bacterium LBB04]|nr:FRG domain-containing protein [Syntrophales bacterium LBB04]
MENPLKNKPFAIVEDLKDFINVKSEFPKDDLEEKWVYRGQESADWMIESTFERARKFCGPYAKLHERWEYEALILREFTRRAYHYTSDLPKANDILEWFALMRHYGAPCRLVDFSYSFYAAVYFALKKVTEEHKYAAIWAIKLQWLEAKFKNLFELENNRHEFRFRNPKDFHDHFLIRGDKKFVAPVNPFRMNHRLTAQQGIFLCPSNIEVSFI